MSLAAPSAAAFAPPPAASHGAQHGMPQQEHAAVRSGSLDCASCHHASAPAKPPPVMHPPWRPAHHGSGSSTSTARAPRSHSQGGGAIHPLTSPRAGPKAAVAAAPPGRLACQASSEAVTTPSASRRCSFQSDAVGADAARTPVGRSGIPSAPSTPQPSHPHHQQQPQQQRLVHTRQPSGRSCGSSHHPPSSPTAASRRSPAFAAAMARHAFAPACGGPPGGNLYTATCTADSALPMALHPRKPDAGALLDSGAPHLTTGSSAPPQAHHPQAADPLQGPQLLPDQLVEQPLTGLPTTPRLGEAPSPSVPTPDPPSSSAAISAASRAARCSPARSSCPMGLLTTNPADVSTSCYLSGNPPHAAHSCSSTTASPTAASWPRWRYAFADGQGAAGGAEGEEAEEGSLGGQQEPDEPETESRATGPASEAHVVGESRDTGVAANRFLDVEKEEEKRGAAAASASTFARPAVLGVGVTGGSLVRRTRQLVVGAAVAECSYEGLGRAGGASEHVGATAVPSPATTASRASARAGAAFAFPEAAAPVPTTSARPPSSPSPLLLELLNPTFVHLPRAPHGAQDAAGGAPPSGEAGRGEEEEEEEDDLFCFDSFCTCKGRRNGYGHCGMCPMPMPLNPLFDIMLSASSSPGTSRQVSTVAEALAEEAASAARSSGSNTCGSSSSGGGGTEEKACHADQQRQAEREGLCVEEEQGAREWEDGQEGMDATVCILAEALKEKDVAPSSSSSSGGGSSSSSSSSGGSSSGGSRGGVEMAGCHAEPPRQELAGVHGGQQPGGRQEGEEGKEGKETADGRETVLVRALPGVEVVISQRVLSSGGDVVECVVGGGPEAAQGWEAVLSRALSGVEVVLSQRAASCRGGVVQPCAAGGDAALFHACISTEVEESPAGEATGSLAGDAPEEKQGQAGHMQEERGQVEGACMAHALVQTTDDGTTESAGRRTGVSRTTAEEGREAAGGAAGSLAGGAPEGEQGQAGCMQKEGGQAEGACEAVVLAPTADARISGLAAGAGVSCMAEEAHEAGGQSGQGLQGRQREREAGDDEERVRPEAEFVSWGQEPAAGPPEKLITSATPTRSGLAACAATCVLASVLSSGRHSANGRMQAAPDAAGWLTPIWSLLPCGADGGDSSYSHYPLPTADADGSVDGERRTREWRAWRHAPSSPAGRHANLSPGWPWAASPAWQTLPVLSPPRGIAAPMPASSPAGCGGFGPAAPAGANLFDAADEDGGADGATTVSAQVVLVPRSNKGGAGSALAAGGVDATQAASPMPASPRAPRRPSRASPSSPSCRSLDYFYLRPNRMVVKSPLRQPPARARPAAGEAGHDTDASGGRPAALGGTAVAAACENGQEEVQAGGAALLVAAGALMARLLGGMGGEGKGPQELPAAGVAAAGAATEPREPLPCGGGGGIAAARGEAQFRWLRNRVVWSFPTGMPRELEEPSWM